MFVKRGKLNPRYIGPFKIIGRVDSMASHLDLTLEYAALHDVFHVTILKKYHNNHSYIISCLIVPISVDMAYEKYPTEIIDRT